MKKSINEYNKMEHSKDEELRKKSINGLYVVMAFGVLFYFIAPFLIGFYLGGNADVFNYELLYMNTVYSFVACYLHAFKHGFKWYVPVAVGLFFIPSCIAFGYISIALMSVVYMVLGLFGDLGGYLMYRHKTHKIRPLGFKRK